MTHLNITQGSTVETVSALIIKKLYETALTVSEPLEGETDAAYMSGHISVPSTYKEYVDYLAGTVGEGSSGVVTSTRLNSGGRFLNLTIDVTNGYYIPFEDPNMLLYLLNLGIGSNNAVTTTEAALAASVKGSTNTVVTKFNELKYFTNVTTIQSDGQAYFRNWTALEEIDFSNIVQLGNLWNTEGAIDNCSSLRIVRNANKLSYIKVGFSNDSNLEHIYGLTGIITIGYLAFWRCSKLSDDTFQNCQILLSSSERHYADMEGCTGLTTITLSPNSDIIPIRCFYGCSNLTILNMSNYDNIGSIGNDAFNGCNKLNFNLSNLTNLTTIENNAFCECSSLNIELNIPKLTLLGSLAFEYTPISKIKCLGKINSIARSTFEKGNDYRAVLTEVYLPYECTSIGQTAFKNNTGLTTFKQYTSSVDNWIEGQTPTFGNTSRLTSIGLEAFYNCSSLSSIDLSNVTNIGNSAFKYCSSLTGTIDLSNVLELGNEAFQGCSGITAITGLSITRFPTRVFADSGITSLDFLSVTQLDTAACNNMSNLTTISNTSDIVTLQTLTFRYCSSLTGVLDFSGLTTLIGDRHFAGTNITGFIAPNLTSTSERMFENCSNLTGNIILKRVTATRGGTFIGCTKELWIFFEDLLTFSYNEFYLASATNVNVIINNVTPPTHLGNTFDVRVNLYVPDTALQTYRDTYTSYSYNTTYLSRIHGISELPASKLSIVNAT